MTTFGESCIIGMLLGEFKGILLCIFAVEAYTASWIEIYHNRCEGGSDWSRLIQPRGLKSRIISRLIKDDLSRLIQPRGLKLDHNQLQP